ncbi:unnamed protein product [Protopolystoma xenopodis]|uniref:Uncharacterized protein n=1 Tax=Protopolystoma xenopodis TaxID=117903 RepID=A0A3S4ZFH8_9PLAT|nr:unnamed protein product [Protopolystoma xenopodis]
MLPRSDDVCHMTDESLPSFHRNRSILPRKQHQHESSSKAKSNPPSSPGGIDLGISSPNTFTRNGSKRSLACPEIHVYLVIYCHQWLFSEVESQDPLSNIN